MAKYQDKNSGGVSLTLFEQCFGDYTIEEKIKIAEMLGEIHKICKL